MGPLAACVYGADKALPVHDTYTHTIQADEPVPQKHLVPQFVIIIHFSRTLTVTGNWTHRQTHDDGI